MQQKKTAQVADAARRNFCLWAAQGRGTRDSPVRLLGGLVIWTYSLYYARCRSLTGKTPEDAHGVYTSWLSSVLRQAVMLPLGVEWHGTPPGALLSNSKT